MSPRSHDWHAWLGLSTIVVVAVAGVFWLARSADDSRDSSLRPISSRITGTGLYVDDALCAECHSQQAETFRQTGHADTFRFTTQSSQAARLDGETFADPERDYTYHYHFDPQAGLSVSIPQKFGEDRFFLTYELGSGKNAITFLTLIPDRLGDTVGIEHRISLYRTRDRWEFDLTPGHRSDVPRQDVDHFGEVVQGDKLAKCIECHTTTATVRRQEIVNLQPNVGCQSCHGPGRQHVIAVEEGGAGDYAGFTRQAALTEIQLCGRCHRLPNQDPETQADPHDIRIVRFQSVGLLQSPCFQRSDGGLKCSTCHDPHQAVSQDSGQYVQRCLDCHSRPEATHCKVSPRSGCIECHMPPVDVHRGILFHDHWIRVRTPAPGTAASPTPAPGSPSPSPAPATNGSP